MARNTSSQVGKRSLRHSAADKGYCHETLGRDARLDCAHDVRIRVMAELCTEAGVLIEDVYFEGGDVLRCDEGRFRFKLGDRPDMVIGLGEAVVIYPGNRVTIEALDGKNLLRYAIMDGTDVAAYFDQFGFFDGVHGRTSTQRAVFEEVKRRLAVASGLTTPATLALLSDALVTYAHDFREGGGALLFDVIRQIRENLRDGIVRLDPLCAQLKVSRARLHRTFAAAHMPTPAEFIRNEQMRMALRLLGNSSKSISDIANETGFLSTSHFATFIKRMTGLSPSDCRRRETFRTKEK